MKKDSSLPGFYFNSAAILFGASFIFFIAQSAYSLIELKAFTMDIGATFLNAVLLSLQDATHSVQELQLITSATCCKKIRNGKILMEKIMLR